MQQQVSPRGRVLPIGGLLLICLMWAWASLRTDMLPRSSTEWVLPQLVAEALLLGSFALLAGIGALVWKGEWPRGKERVSAVLAGVGLFVAPALVTEGSKGWISGSTRVALFSLTPVFAAVFEPYLESDTTHASPNTFAAALIAVSGTMLAFSIDLPRSIGSGLSFLGVIVASASAAAANCVGVRIASRLGSGLTLRFAVIAASCASLGLGVLSAAFWARQEAMVPVNAWSALDLSALVLLFWLMGRMRAVHMSARFLIGPLLANLIAIAFFRPGVDLRGWAGLALITIGSGWMLLAREDGPELTGSSLPNR